MAASNQSMLEVMEALNKRMAQFESDLQSTASTSSTDSLAADFIAFKTFTMQVLRTFQEQLQVLVHNVDQQEMRSRRKILLFHGVPEDKKDSIDTVTNTITKQLKMPDLSSTNISRCQRMGRATQDRPRPLLVKFNDLDLRNKVWFAKTKFKGSGITVSEFLTRTRHEAFMLARQQFGVAKCWTRDGYVHIIGPDNTRHRVISTTEIQKIMPPASAKPTAEECHPPRTRRAAAAISKK